MRRMLLAVFAFAGSLAFASPALAVGPSCSGAVPPCAPPLVNIGGATAVTQASPTIFLVFWGSHWNNGSYRAHTAVMNAEVSLFQALAGNTGGAAAYNSILTQYLGAGNQVPNYGGSWVDTTDPPASLQSSDFQGEVDRAIGQNEGWFAGQNVQFMIFPEEKTTGNQLVKVSFVGEEKPDFCGYHDYRTTGTINGVEIYDVEPWIESLAKCLGYGSGTGSAQIVNAMTTVSTHEYAEAATDPYWNSTTGQKGWQTNQETLYEIGDLCAYTGVNVAGLGSVQYLWDNASNACITS